LLSTKSHLELLTSGDVTFIQKAIMKNHTYSDKCGITAFEAAMAGITLFETVPFSSIIHAKIGIKTAINT